ncbi:MAG: Lhr family helicase, partial [Stellaceae bacterium]
GNTAYRILRTERGTVRVADAEGMAPNIPFWLGEAPGRSDELSQAVSRLRAAMAARLGATPQGEDILPWLKAELGLAGPAALQLLEYLAAARAALGTLPTQETLVFERFFDEAGGMQLVIHSPYGSRINRAWGLALRKRFCRKFNFELQAAATEDHIALSLTAAHSFELAEVARYLNSASVRTTLIQAMLDAPMFITRWRWVAGVALALPRFRGGKKVPPQLARMDAEDLIGAVFPDQIACAENLAGDREIPDHPLVNQAIGDCLTEAMDIEGLERLLRALEGGSIKVVARDLTEPSPLALEAMSARPYAFLDDAPLEERRTQAVMARRWLAPETAAEIGQLDAEAITRVKAETWPDAQNADELHDALVWLGFMTNEEIAAEPRWIAWFDELAREKRAARLRLAPATLYLTAERLRQFQALWPAAKLDPAIAPPAKEAERATPPEEALVEILRGRLEGLGPVTRAALAAPLGLDGAEVDAALTALESEGFAMRGRFSPGATAEEWCERRLLARIHRYTVKRLRAEIEPVAARDFLRFLCEWQRVEPDTRMEGPDAVEAVLAQLEGFEAPAGAWESEILPARVEGYEPAWLDDLCLSGRIAWMRLAPRSAQARDGERAAGPLRTTPITLLARRHASHWLSLSPFGDAARPGSRAQAILDFISQHGASFFDELVDGAGLLRPEVEDALAELVALGIINSDSFGGLRALLVPADQRRGSAGQRRRRAAFGMDDAGRWALMRRAARGADAGGSQRDGDASEHVARVLLRRYGVVFWRLLEREAAWLPPWRDLLRVYRRLEARGDIRSGRFVSGFSGEQFALPDAIGALREVRRKEGSGALISVSGADPLNLAGSLTPGGKLPALATNRLLYRDGIPIALFAGGEVRFLEKLDAGEEWQARKALL